MTPRSDLIRQLAVTVSFVAGLIGTLAGVGLIGTEVNRSSGGALSADATLLTPATQAFSIWSVIYVGLTAYLIWQWLPAHAHSRTARETGWWAAASLLLNGAWLGVTQAGWLWVSVLVIALLTYVLARLCLSLVGRGPSSLAELLIVYVTFGLYLGWVCVATVANVTAAAVGTGARLGEAAPVARRGGAAGGRRHRCAAGQGDAGAARDRRGDGLGPGLDLRRTAAGAAPVADRWRGRRTRWRPACSPRTCCVRCRRG